MGMGRRAFAVAAACALAAACTTFGSSSSDSGDAGAPEGGSGCASMSPAPFFCADFDETNAVVFDNGIPVAIPAPPGGIDVTPKGPAASGTNALWITGKGSQYAIDFQGPSGSQASKLTARLQVDFAHFDAQSGESAFLWIGTQQPQCRLQGMVDVMAGQPTLLIESFCPLPDGSSAPYAFVSPVPAAGGFVAIDLVLDLANGKGSMAVAHGKPVEIELGYVSASPLGLPFVKLGLIGQNLPTAGPTFALDDVVVTVE